MTNRTIIDVLGTRELTEILSMGYGVHVTQRNRTFITDGDKLVFSYCTECEEVIYYDDFAKNKSKLFGVGNICLNCDALRCKKYDKAVDGTLRTMISGMRSSAKNRYDTDIPEPTPTERQRLRERLETAMNGGTCVYTGKPMTRTTISAEHPTPILRRESAAFDIAGGFYDSIVFVDRSENYRKGSRSFLEYAADWADDERHAAMNRIADCLGVPYGTIEQTVLLDDLEAMATV